MSALTASSSRSQSGSPSGRSLAELQRPVLASVTVAAALQVAATVLAVTPVVVLVEVGRRLVHGSGAVWPLVWVAAGLLLARFVLYAVAGLLSHQADARLAHSLRGRLVDQLANLPLSWFAGGVSARVRTAVQDDVAALHHAVAHARGDLASAIAGPVVVTAYLAWLDWPLALVTVALVVLAQSIRMRLKVRAAEPVGRIAAANAELAGAVLETIRGNAVLRAYSGDRGAVRFAAAAAELADADEQAALIFVRPRSLARATVAPATVLAVLAVVAVPLVSAGRTDPVDLVAFALLGVGLFDLLTPIYSARDLNERAKAAAGRVAGLLREPRQAEVRHGRQPGRPLVVEFDDVGFSYGDREVLHGVTARLEPGTVTALVGSSGAGKSTLAMLLARFADVDAGSIRLGGVDLREIERAELYRHVGFLLQDVVLLDRSVRDNIALTRPDATDAEVYDAARAAAVHDEILALPRGYDSVVGEDARLSGGQAQRVAIARTLLARTPVIVLDEATAFADPDSEAAVQDALAALATGRTLLVIAHRLHTITAVDQILVLDEGRLVESGTHAELLAAGPSAGRYARLWWAQQHTQQHTQRAGAGPDGGVAR